MKSGRAFGRVRERVLEAGTNESDERQKGVKQTDKSHDRSQASNRTKLMVWYCYCLSTCPPIQNKKKIFF